MALTRQSNRSASWSYSRVLTGFTDDNNIGVGAGNYPYMIGGWYVPLDSAAVNDNDIGLVVNCSGMLTKDGVHTQCPELKDFATNVGTGCQPV